MSAKKFWVQYLEDEWAVFSAEFGFEGAFSSHDEAWALVKALSERELAFF